MAARGGQDFIPSAARRGKQCSKPIPVRPIAAAVKAQATLKWGDYMLRQQIGAGATGKVYRALDRNQNRDVAIKFLRKSLTTSSTVVERFVREARTVAELNQPGIVAVHGMGQTPGGGLFLVMDLVRGRDLDLVRRAALVEPSQAAAWVADAARIVHAAHERGVIHCDLKPSNLLLDQAGRILVTDFGLAVRSDDWGLGGVLYFLIAGHAPHSGSDLACVLASIVSAAPVSFAAPEFGAMPQGVLAALRQCLAKRPDDRLCSAVQLADHLHSQSTPS